MQKQSNLQLDMTESRELSLVRVALIQQFKIENQQKRLNISDQDLQKKVDQYMLQNKENILNSIQKKMEGQQFKTDEEKEKAYKTAIKAVAIGLTPVFINGLLTLGIYAVGFTTTGVAAGSLAAGIQSVFYGGTIAEGGAFATLQSLGAAGTGVAGLPILLGGGIILVALYFLFRKKKQEKQKK